MKKISLIALTALTVACNNSTSELAFDMVEIQHQSADVSPEYQRSYFIVASEDNIHVVIKGHENTIVDTNFDNSSAQFAEYAKSYEYLDKGKTELIEDCNGCPVREINLRKDNKTIYSAKWNKVDNHPALQRLVDVVINSIPGFGNLLARSEKE